MTTGQILKNSVDSLKNSQAGYATTKGVGLFSVSSKSNKSKLDGAASWQYVNVRLS